MVQQTAVRLRGASIAAAVAACVTVSVWNPALAQAPQAAPAVGAPQGTPAAQAAPGRQGGGRQGGGGGGMQGGGPIAFEDRSGFRQIFDGQTLNGWDGDPTFWRAEGGSIVGESTAAKVVSQNTFLIWRGGEPADFELKLEFRMNSTNSGVQYRSTQLTPGSPDGNQGIGRWVLKGYQADIDFANQYTGMLYEERGRTMPFLAARGQFGFIGPNQPAAVARGQQAPPQTTPAGPRGQLAQVEDGEALKAYIKQNDWNQMHIIARGNMLVHIINGHVTSMFLDDDPAGRSLRGLIGLQIHTGPPMKIEFRNVYLKTL
jgi:hypothetical protein